MDPVRPGAPLQGATAAPCLQHPSPAPQRFQVLCSSLRCLKKCPGATPWPPLCPTEHCSTRDGAAERVPVWDISYPNTEQGARWIQLPFALHPPSLPAREHTFPSLQDVSDVVTTACTSWLARPSSSSHNKRRFLCARIQEVSCREHCKAL